MFHMQLYLSLSCFSRVTRFKSWSLHLNTFNKFELDLKLVINTTENRMHRRFVTYFATSPFTISPCWERFILQTRMPLWFLVECWLRNTENVLKAKQSFLTMQSSFITASLMYLHKAGHGPTVIRTSELC